MKSITLPDIGEGVVEGEVVSWLKNIGDRVKKDEGVVVVMTDKATVELPSPYAGILAKQYYAPGEKALVGKPLYDIEESDKILATPKTRGLAKELGIDIQSVRGSGEDGHVLPQDLKKIAPSSSPSDDEEIPLHGIRGMMAKKMIESTTHSAQFSYFDEADATRLVHLKERLQEKAVERNLHLTYMPLIIRAMSVALKEYPLVNSSIENDKILVHKHHNIGVAMATKDGLIVPVIKDVQNLSLFELTAVYEALMEKAKSGKLTPGDMRGSTISVTNFGPLGGRFATPILNYPESAIVGIAKIRKQPAVINDALTIRDTLNLSFTFDHRIIDGQTAAFFCNKLISLLENPAPLL